MDGQPTIEQTPDDPFPYEYRGAGYFRRKGVAVGEAAHIVHAPTAMEFLKAQLVAARAEVESLKNQLRGATDGGV